MSENKKQINQILAYKLSKSETYIDCNDLKLITIILMNKLNVDERQIKALSNQIILVKVNKYRKLRRKIIKIADISVTQIKYKEIFDQIDN